MGSRGSPAKTTANVEVPVTAKLKLVLEVVQREPLASQKKIVDFISCATLAPATHVLEEATTGMFASTTSTVGANDVSSAFARSSI